MAAGYAIIAIIVGLTSLGIWGWWALFLVPSTVCGVIAIYRWIFRGPIYSRSTADLQGINNASCASGQPGK